MKILKLKSKFFNLESLELRRGSYVFRLILSPAACSTHKMSNCACDFETEIKNI